MYRLVSRKYSTGFPIGTRKKCLELAIDWRVIDNEETRNQERHLAQQTEDSDQIQL